MIESFLYRGGNCIHLPLLRPLNQILDPMMALQSKSLSTSGLKECGCHITTLPLCQCCKEFLCVTSFTPVVCVRIYMGVSASIRLPACPPVCTRACPTPTGHHQTRISISCAGRVSSSVHMVMDGVRGTCQPPHHVKASV